MKVEIELHDSTEFPVVSNSTNTMSGLSVPVYAMDEMGFPAALVYNFRTSEWEELDGDTFDDTIDFTWFYVPEGLGL